RCINGREEGSPGYACTGDIGVDGGVGRPAGGACGWRCRDRARGQATGNGGRNVGLEYPGGRGGVEGATGDQDPESDESFGRCLSATTKAGVDRCLPRCQERGRQRPPGARLTRRRGSSSCRAAGQTRSLDPATAEAGFQAAAPTAAARRRHGGGHASSVGDREKNEFCRCCKWRRCRRRRRFSVGATNTKSLTLPYGLGPWGSRAFLERS
ncbi:unnamed protein product, partial [Ectocarpus sp. 12 AP-2014]